MSKLFNTILVVNIFVYLNIIFYTHNDLQREYNNNNNKYYIKKRRKGEKEEDEGEEEGQI